MPRAAVLPEPLGVPVVDNHTHLDITRDDEPATLGSIGAALEAARSVGVDRVVHIGCDLAAAEFAVTLAHAFPGVLAGVALHPNEAPRLAARGELEAAYVRIAELAQDPRVRVVGETGLDHFRTGEDGREAQEESFGWHIALAKRLGKVLQIHDRDAHDDVLRVLAEHGAPERTVMHCFSGDAAMARECVERGYHVSFAGNITFKNAGELRAALEVVPLDLLLVETDAPYLTPHPYRGASNAPALVPYTVRAMAQVLGRAEGAVAEALAANAERLYGPW